MKITSAKEKRLFRLLVTSDVHGYVYPYDYATTKEKAMGLAKLSTLVQALRDEHTLLVDNGDAFEGSPLSFYHFKDRAHHLSPATLAMKAMKYDYVNLGNHDFNYGQVALKQHLNHLSCPCLTGNIKGLFDENTLEKTCVIREINGQRIGLFGVVTHYIPNWENPEHIQGLTFEDAFQYAQKCVAYLREKVDYVIGFYHGGFEKDLSTGAETEAQTGENQGYRMLKEIKGLDILVTGHQHRSLAQCFETEGSRVVLTQTADKGQELAVIDVYPSGIEARVVSPQVPADKYLLTLVSEEEEACQNWLDKILGKSQVDLWVEDEHQARFEKHAVVSFLNQVALEATGADLAANALFNGAKGFKSEITVRDIVSTYVYPNTMVIKKVNRSLLKAYLEKNAEFFVVENGRLSVNPRYVSPKPQYYNYDMVDGIEYTFDLRKPFGQRVTSILYKGKELEEDQFLTLAINNYRAAGGGDFEMMKEAETVKEITQGMVELIINYILLKKEIDFVPKKNIHLIY